MDHGERIAKSLFFVNAVSLSLSLSTRHVKAFDESSDGVVRSEGLPNSDVKRYLDLFGGHARKGKHIFKY